MRCPPWKIEELTPWTQQHLCGLLRLHLGLPAEAHETQMSSYLPETETVPTILVMASFCEIGQAGEVALQSLVRLQVVLAKPGAP